MKQRVANYSVVLLFFIAAFGLVQAKKQNRNPFRSLNIQYVNHVKSNQTLTKNATLLQSQYALYKDITRTGVLKFEIGNIPSQNLYYK